MKLTLGQVADWIHAEGDFTTSSEAVGYSIDSRTIGAGELFFAVTGDRVDGHDYVEAALANGAVAAVVSNRWLASDEPREVDPCKLLWVPEGEECVLRAMQLLALRVRQSWGGRVIGVTGSAGKTTTKEMVATVLSSQFSVLKSAGNLNNHFGVPLQLLRLEAEHEVAVIEMGMNHSGEIKRLAEIAEPQWGVVSNVAAVHLEFFPAGIAGIAAAKRELIEALPSDGLAILNGDDEWVRGFGVGVDSVLYGLGDEAQVRATNVVEAGLDGVSFTVHAGGDTAEVHLALLGKHNVSNALAAIAVGWKSGMTLTACAAALAEMRATDKRGAVIEWRGAKLLNDSYNSNPKALDAMVDALISTPATRRIVVAGEMLELGPEGPALHKACGRRMAEQGVDLIVGVRGLAADLVSGAGEKAVFVETPEAAGNWLTANVKAGDVVLLKASRGVRLERALEKLG
ncbi:UDP-N-acetylmuramoyl-tripeptide--D-alanyl-D-alanine ligase [Granulicella tundricola]|uniref:UDP-N-acetylmuramoyl-tripeptide--D-alanyl-D-alanine ligase n=1 Tax=Granulicella tundricola (strain ATCC BAA-1859 / DSM 23138 / MP5ACTX9) TaxID=1198114 RepID=E8WX99_GRATM|nr:UDP-N-acetylmuramoyl-tripeptide--D-alanyl-D-alanine ligase [Granulicella tundricola]ADW69741.1 UDP-N-acetylmuramoylalanyl-D-glutamyl-2,6-diaminopimelate/D-alanyl-D-alanyl ligase [Granulicella tundricola MP5ACTX9]